MNRNIYKLTTIFLLGTILIAFTHCGNPMKGSELLFESNVYGGSSALSYNAFEKTVYPITRANCVSCHANTQPLHASANVMTAHDAVISGFKVNFANIPSSRLVAKLRDENHNCWSDCSQNAKEMEDAITEWNEAIKGSGPVTTSSSGLKTTTESRTLSEELAGNNSGGDAVSLNVAAAMLTSPMTRGTDANGTFLLVPIVGGSAPLTVGQAGAGKAFLNFTVPASNTKYRLWALVLAPTSSDDSVFISVNNNSGVSNFYFDAAESANAQWLQVPIDFNLSAGINYTMELAQREDGIKLYKFIMTADASFNPSTGSTSTGSTLKFDISSQSKVPGATFQIEVSDYDLYSYKFSRPRVVTATKNILVKSVKLLINKTYNPQHSTYAAVNTVVSPALPSISPHAMIAIKDQGAAADKISFSFELLEGSELPAGDAPMVVTGPDSLAGFTSSVYVISRTNCINCHMNQSPRHASDNNLTAHDDLLNRNSVDFTNPQSSRIVQKMRERHNCGLAANCDALAQQYIDAIIEWKKNR